MSLSRGAITLAACLAACGPTSREVVVELTLPGAEGAAEPLAGQPVIVLPYDRDSVIAALETQAPTPRPHAAALDSLYDAFTEPYRAVSAAATSVSRLERRVTELRAGLDSLGRGTPEYGPAFAAERRVSDSLAMARRDLERAQAALVTARRRLQGPIDSLRREVHEWEAAAYAGYDTLTNNLAESRLRTPALDTTDASGRASFDLPPGSWWIYARAWDATDPNREWYWNLPAGQDTVRLDSRTGTRRSRY